MKLPTDTAGAVTPEGSNHLCEKGSQFILKRIGPPLAEPLEIDTSERIREIWRDFVSSRECFDASKESVIVIALNGRNQFMGWHLVTTGTECSAYFGPRDVLRAALAIDASSIVLVHNHPSGNVSPSRDDERATRRIGEACVILGVEFLDHVVVDSAGERSYSMRKSYPQMFHVGNVRQNVKASPSPAVAAEVLVKVSMPDAFTWGVVRKTLQIALSSTIEATTEAEWVQQWKNAKDLKNYHRRAAVLKRHHSLELLLTFVHFERVRRAANKVGKTPEDLLVAMAARVSDGLKTWAEVAKADETTQVEVSKIVPFFRPRITAAH